MPTALCEPRAVVRGSLRARCGPALILLPVNGLAEFGTMWLSYGRELFYVQHQFERTLWTRPPHWTPEKAALYGSSYLLLTPRRITSF